jgi:hypothetical protein
MMKRAASALVFVAACVGTTINVKDYNQSCDADTDCVVVQVGDICACDCDLGAINDIDYDKYTGDVQRIGTCIHSCLPNDPDAAPYVCGGGTGARCSSGTGTTYALPTDAGAE